MSNYNWAILGCGVVANEMANALTKAGKKIYAVGNRTHEKAVAFSERYGVERVYDDLHEMFTDPKVDVIYITTPHNTHIDFLREALSHGKHVLCEKSITLNTAELEEAKALAEENNVVLAEAMTIYHMPLIKELRRRVEAGEFGRVNVLTMNFGSYKEYNMKNRFFNKALAGGAMLDIGVYALSMARCFMKEKPTEVVSKVTYAPSGSDEQSGIVLLNPDGQLATVCLSMHSKQPKRAMISCDKAFIEVMDYPRPEQAVITWTETGDREILRVGSHEGALGYEMEDMEKAIDGDRDDICLDYTTDVMELMTDIRKEWGYTYEGETL
jgi:predicted dehydrogenase